MEIWMDVDTALSEVPVNKVALIDDTDFKTREESVVYNQAGMDLVWNFVTTAGVYTQTAVTPTTAGDYDWTNQGNGMYSIEIPASGGASINNDTEGFGWFTGYATGILPWTGPIIGFRAAALNNALIDGGDNLDVNVTQYGGTNGTFSGGRPEVNSSHFAGTAYATALAAEVDAIWDEPIAGHLTAGTAGLSEALGSAALVDSTITGTPTSTTFDFTGGSTANNFYKDQLVYILSGTGIGQVRPILSTSYSGGTTTVTVDEAWITTPAAADRFAVLVSHVHPKSQITADIDANSTQLAAIVADTNELQTDLANGGRLDTILDELTTQGDTNETKLDTLTTNVATVDTVVDSILVDTGTTLPATLGTPAGADLATDIANIAAVLPTDRIAVDVTFSGGTTTTAVLVNVDGAAASSTNDVYNGRVLVFNAGTLDKQVTDITDYDGATKTATITAVTTAVTGSHTAILL